MPVIVKVASGPRGGASNASKYIAERALDRERESRETRQIFSAREDNLTRSKADSFLAGEAGSLEKEDLQHLIVSLLPEEFERLGDDDPKRIVAFREVAREALGNLSARDLEGYELRWVAAPHLNTRLPHLHVLLHKELVNRVTGEKKVLHKIPKEFLAERGSMIRGEDPARLGKISQRFQEALDEHSKPFRRVEVRDTQGRTLASREVVEAKALEREPTFEEVSVGRWVMAEAHAARAEGKDVPPPLALREYVRKLDERNAARGLKPTAAFLSREQISELTSGRGTGLGVSFQTATTDRLSEPERATRETLERAAPRDEHERRRLGRAHVTDEDQERSARAPKEVNARGQQSPEATGAVGRGTQLPRLSEEGSRSPLPKAMADVDAGRPSGDGVGKEKAAYPKRRASASGSVPDEAYKKRLRAQEELFEKRGVLIVQRFLALSVNPRQVKEFHEAAKKELEAGRHVDALVKSYREKFGEAAPAGAILSASDKDHLIKNTPALRHPPSIVRNDFLREVFAAKTSDRARSYLPRETRPTPGRGPARSTGRSGRGR